jgi:hypothetical protein
MASDTVVAYFGFECHGFAKDPRSSGLTPQKQTKRHTIVKIDEAARHSRHSRAGGGQTVYLFWYGGDQGITPFQSVPDEEPHLCTPLPRWR